MILMNNEELEFYFREKAWETAITFTEDSRHINYLILTQKDML